MFSLISLNMLFRQILVCLFHISLKHRVNANNQCGSFLLFTWTRLCRKKRLVSFFYLNFNRALDTLTHTSKIDIGRNLFLFLNLESNKVSKNAFSPFLLHALLNLVKLHKYFLQYLIHIVMEFFMSTIQNNEKEKEKKCILLTHS